MKNCAIVCEYNPFHSGHKYQINAVRARSVDNIVCVMSGSFVQSATPAFCDKSIRAKCAVLGGADAVAELPVVYATAGAQIFAEGAVKVMRGIKDIAYIAMGASASADEILRLCDVKIKHHTAFTAELKKNLSEGKNYNAASARALATVCSTVYSDKLDVARILVDPNNILSIEYVTAVDKLCANIQPIIIERKGRAYNETEIYGEHISATAIRNEFDRGNAAAIEKYVPFMFDEISQWRNKHAPDIELYKSMAVFAAKTAAIEYIKDLRDCSEGLEYSIKNMSGKCDYDDYTASLTSKRYSKKRINRLFLDILLGINKKSTDMPFVTRLLACKNGFDFSILPDYVKTNNAAIKSAADGADAVREVLSVDINATALYNTLAKLDGDYFNYSVIKI